MEEFSAAPLVAAMRQYVAEQPYAYHTPGHKQGLGIPPEIEAVLNRQALQFDVSLMEELDDLFAPHGCIQAAQALAAKLYGAQETFFVVNGTTGGIHAMMMAVLQEGDSIILPRNVHRSVFGGLVLSGARPVYIQPEVDRELSISLGITPENLQSVLTAESNIKSLLLVNPTYYGTACALESLVELAHARNVPVLVDEAHGGHCRFNKRLPQQALDAGADICVQSTHKLLGALTQASMVHLQGQRVSTQRLQEMLTLLQSTSPNYFLLASLDAARAQMAAEGEWLWEQALFLAEKVRTALNQVPGLFCFGEEKSGSPGFVALDITKLTVYVDQLGLSGRQAGDILRCRYGIQPELIGPDHILFLITYADTDQTANYLIQALTEMAHEHWVGEKKEKEFLQLVPPIPPLHLTPRQAAFCQKRTVSFREATGQVAAETIMVYPPGIPLVYPGEELTRPILECIEQQQQQGLYFSGRVQRRQQEILVADL